MLIMSVAAEFGIVFFIQVLLFYFRYFWQLFKLNVLRKCGKSRKNMYTSLSS